MSPMDLNGRLGSGLAGAGVGTMFGGFPLGTAIGGGIGFMVGPSNTPGQNGYGISGGGYGFEPYSTGPGLTFAEIDPIQGRRFGQADAGGGDLARAPERMDQISPGVGEQFFNNQQHRFGEGGNAANFYGATQGAYGQPGQGEQYWQGLAGARNAPQASQQAWGAAQNMGPGMLGGYAQQNLGRFGQPTQTEGQYQEARGQLAGPTASSQYARQNMGRMGAPTAAEQYFAASGQGLQNQPRNSQAVFDSFRASEPGLDPYYARATQQTTEDMNQALAAQGLMGSSYGGEATGDALSALRAEQANREADYRLREVGLAGQLAGQADAGRLDVFRTGGQLAGQADQSRLAQIMGGGQLAGQADQAQLSRAMGLGGLAGASDQNRLAYLQGGGQLAGMADQGGLAQMGLYGDFAQRADSAQLARDLGYGQLAFGAQDAALGRLGQGFGQGLGVDQMDLARAQGGMDAAAMAQNLYQGRGQQMLNNQMAYSNQLAGMAGGTYDAMFGQDQQLMDAALASESGLALQALLASQRQQQQNTEGTQGLFGFLGDVKSGGGISNMFQGIF